MKAPHKSVLAHVAKDATRYAIKGAWLAKIPTMDGSSRWAWCATDGRTAAVAYLDDADAKEAEEADSGHGRKNGLSSTVFPLEVLERKGAFRLIPEGLRIASVAFVDGTSFRLMDMTPPMLDSIVRDEIRVGEEHRINVYVNADRMIASLEAAVIGTRATRAGSKDDSDRMVRLSFRATDGLHESRDAIDDAAPILVTPAKPEHAGKALVVCMPCSLNAEENKAREKRLKAAVKAAQEREEDVLALRRRVADLTREVARLEGAAQAAQEVRP